MISMANDYRGPLTEFALVVPVPQVLEREPDPHRRAAGCSSASMRTARRASPSTTIPIRASAKAAALMDRASAQPLPASVAKEAAKREKALGVTVEARPTRSANTTS